MEGVKVSLGVDAWGEITFDVTKDGKPLADIPAKLKKDPKIAALRARKVELKRQASRIRPSLEQFMVRGDEFSGGELRELMDHPLLAPMLKNLVIVGEGIIGYPVHEGKALEDPAGRSRPSKRGKNCGWRIRRICCPPPNGIAGKRIVLRGNASSHSSRSSASCIR